MWCLQTELCLSAAVVVPVAVRMRWKTGCRQEELGFSLHQAWEKLGLGPAARGVSQTHWTVVRTGAHPTKPSDSPFWGTLPLLFFIPVTMGRSDCEMSRDYFGLDEIIIRQTGCFLPN